MSWTERFVSWGFEEVLLCLEYKRHGIKFSWINSLLAEHDDGQRGQLSVGTETNRAYTTLYKHVFVEPSVINLLKLESVGSIRALILNTIGRILNLKKLTLYVLSNMHAWQKGHFWLEISRTWQ